MKVFVKLSVVLMLLSLTLIGCGGNTGSNSNSTSSKSKVYKGIPNKIYARHIVINNIWKTVYLEEFTDSIGNFRIILTDEYGNPIQNQYIFIRNENGVSHYYTPHESYHISANGKELYIDVDYSNTYINRSTQQKSWYMLSELQPQYDKYHGVDYNKFNSNKEKEYEPEYKKMYDNLRLINGIIINEMLVENNAINVNRRPYNDEIFVEIETNVPEDKIKTVNVKRYQIILTCDKSINVLELGSGYIIHFNDMGKIKIYNYINNTVFGSHYKFHKSFLLFH